MLLLAAQANFLKHKIPRQPLPPCPLSCPSFSLSLVLSCNPPLMPSRHNFLLRRRIRIKGWHVQSDMRKKIPHLCCLCSQTEHLIRAAFSNREIDKPESSSPLSCICRQLRLIVSDYAPPESVTCKGTDTPSDFHGSKIVIHGFHRSSLSSVHVL